MRSTDAGASVRAETSTVHRVRGVLSIRPFRRLWGVTYLCSIADWLTILGLTGLVTKMTENYTAQSFAFSGVVLAQLIPGLIFAPLGGLLADRFDRRKVMIICDVLRCALLLSIALIGTGWWLFIANFLVGCCSTMWIPAKDSAVPNLLRRRDQVETATQLGLVMTYGLAVVTGAGLYAIITGIPTTFHLPPDVFGGLGLAKIIVVCNGLLYLTSALLIATRIPELSLRNVHEEPTAKPEDKTAEKVADTTGGGLLTMFRDGGRFVRSTPLVRGLLIGMFGAFAAGGAVVGSSKPYSSSLGGGDSSFGLLLVAVFVGLASGMAGAPRLARRLQHNRLFGIAIVFAGVALIAVALAPHLAIALVASALVGACAGAAFLTGVTIIGSQIEDSIRGRVNAIYQSGMKVILGGSVALAPVLIGLVQRRTVNVWGNTIVIDGTRPVLLGGGLLAALVGVVAYRQMGDRSTEPILADLRNAIRRTPRRVNGFLIAVEGTAVTDTATHAERLATWLRSGTRNVVLAEGSTLDDNRLLALISGASLSGARAQALAAAAVRADIVERDVQPALDAGATVVMERFVDSPLAHLSTVAGLDSTELEGLSDWATGRLRPDVTVLLDTDPGVAAVEPASSSEQQWRVQHVLAEMAAADPDHYVVVDAEGSETDVAERVRTAVQAVLVGRDASLLPEVAEKADR